MRCMVVLGMCLIGLFGQTCLAKATAPIEHVIYLTLDGTRWQDIYLDQFRFPKLWHEYAKQGHFYGLPNSQEKIEVAAIPVSLPSYQSQMAGSVQACNGNECGRIPVETLPEYLLRRFNLQRQDVVVFSSWWEIGLALEHKLGAVLSNIGNAPVQDPVTATVDPIMQALNNEQLLDQPTDERDRFDPYTFAQALHYFEKYQPRFMWIALTDADKVAHEEDLNAYHHMLSFYDNAIDALFKKLASLNLTAKTMVIITTDHGRADGANWVTHGPEFPESKQTWAFVMNGELQPDPTQAKPHYYSTLSIRPTIIEALQARLG